MTAEDIFIKDLEDYFFSGRALSKFDCGRVKRWLTTYAKNIPQPQPITIMKEVVKKVYLEKPQEEDSEDIKRIATVDDVNREAHFICEKYGVNYYEFRFPEFRKCKSRITSIRSEFVVTMLSSYDCDRKLLETFFNVDHSSISYYIHGKRSAANREARKIKQLSKSA